MLEFHPRVHAKLQRIMEHMLVDNVPVIEILVVIDFFLKF
jgi:hypothetical protein